MDYTEGLYPYQKFSAVGRPNLYNSLFSGPVPLPVSHDLDHVRADVRIGGFVSVYIDILRGTRSTGGIFCPEQIPACF